MSKGSRREWNQSQDTARVLVPGGLLSTLNSQVQIIDLTMEEVAFNVQTLGNCEVYGGLLLLEGGTADLNGVTITNATADMACGPFASVVGSLMHLVNGDWTLTNVVLHEVQTHIHSGQSDFSGQLHADSRQESLITDIEVRNTRVAISGPQGGFATGAVTTSGPVSIVRYVAVDNELWMDPAAGQGTVMGAALNSGAFFSEGIGSFRGLDLRGNRAIAHNVHGGAATFSGHAVIRSTIVAGNTAGNIDTALAEGGGVYAINANPFDVAHLDIVGNVAQGDTASGGGLYVDPFSVIGLTHTSLVSNQTEGTSVDEGAAVTISGSAAGWRYNNVYASEGSEIVTGIADPVGTEGNLAVDPQYIDVSSDLATDWDLMLAPESPLIDAGDPFERDADGSVADIGAYGGPGWP